MTSPLARVAVFQLGGAAGQVDEMAMAASHRDAAYMLAINNGWKNPADNEQQIQWTRDFWKQKRVKVAYGAGKYERLVEVKNRYDPENFFGINQNVEPRRRSHAGAERSSRHVRS